MYCTRRINDDYTWVGADGRRLAMFEGVFDVPAGISFNSYLLRDEKTVLFDTTDAAVRRTFRENLLHALEGRSLDCVVVHHMEPDHTAELEELVLRFPEVQIYCSAMAKTMMTQFFGTGFQERIHVVKEGDTLCTGRHTLRFIAAPMVHWPEVLMTYDETDRLLLTADAFGCFGALNGRLFADEVDFPQDWLAEARRYYANIVGKYGAQVQALLKKTSALEIQTICPLHGPVLTEGLEECLRLYDLWSQWEPEESESILIAHASIHGNTAHAAKTLKGKLEKKGVQVNICDLTVTDLSYAVASAFYCGKLVLASSTYDGGLFPPMREFLEHLRTKGFRNRRVGLIENGSWAPAAARLMRTKLEEMKDIHLYETVVSLRGALNQTSEAQMDALVAELCAE